MQPEAVLGGTQSEDVAALGPREMADIEMQLAEGEEQDSDFDKQWSPRGVSASEPATDGAFAHIGQIQNNAVRAMKYVIRV